MITVQDALTIGPLRKARLVGGEKGIKRVVTSLNVMDAPDIINWVKEGELLLTTAYVIKDDPVALEKLIAGLDERGCAGLAVKARRYLELCPEYMIEAANRRDFPLIELPSEHSLSDIMVPLLAVMLNRKSVLLEQSLDIHQKLTRVALKGGKMKDVIQALAELVDNPVLLHDETGTVLASAGGETEVKEEKAVKLAREPDRGLESAPVRSAKVPVIVYHRIVGQIIVQECSRAVNDFDRMAMEHAATVIALYYIRQMTIDEAAEQHKTEFLDDLLAGKVASYAALNNRAMTLGFKTGLHYGCIVFNVDRFSKQGGLDDYDDNIMIKNQIGKQLCRGIEKAGLPVVTIRKGNRYFVFAGHHPDKYKAPSSFVPSVIEHVKAVFSPIELSAGYGKIAPLQELRNSCESALNSLEIGMKISEQEPFVSGHKEVEVYHLLQEGLKGGELDEFVRLTVGGILEYDLESKTELLKTLDIYFQCQGNITKAAQQLYIHRNTMIYRLDRIRSLLKHRSLDNPEEMLSLQLGIRAAKLIKPRFIK
ncbi:MAG: PucR family transcriptional regulator [Firmicutes bacterium]|nr:PucR family transcriptional regulator [Bacillota bacterium]